MEGSDWVVFRITTCRCALRADDVWKVVHIPLLTSPPGLPPLVIGFMNLAGLAVPVLPLDRLLGQPGGRFHPYLHVLILKSANRPLGLLVERVEAIVRLRDQDMTGVHDDESLNGCIRSRARIGGEEVFLVATERLLDARETRVLSELQAIQQQRLAELGVAS